MQRSNNHTISIASKMSNTQSPEMECGSSLAEDAWATPIPAATASEAAQTQTISSRDEALLKLRQLRSQIASDIITDPTTNGSAFPTFLSPLQLPSTSPHTGTHVPLIYCDHTASHRPSSSIENYLRSTSYPCHANTHTNITYTGSQSTAFVAEARQIVAESTGARVTGKASLDSVIFAGNGVTGAVATLIDALNLRGSINTDSKRPVVFVGPHEHHSNLLPWREAGCEVVNVPAKSGMVDLTALESMLSSNKYGHHSNRLRMGAFSAVSNVTGVIADVDQIATLLHKYNCLAFFDYASGAPYVKMNMNPGGEAYKDAIYFSPHKCFGGTSTPGVLVVKKRLVSQTNPPRVCGGGTVFYVTEGSHRFLSNRIERYEVSYDKVLKSEELFDNRIHNSFLSRVGLLMVLGFNE
jgi:selenocysteine lyase/cysteine desulfurase